MQDKTGYVDLGDGNVYYEVAGEGPPVVFLHAAFVDSRMWDDQCRFFSQDYTIIRFDIRGFGKSENPQGPVSRRQELYQVLESAGVNRAVLVGCSLGGETILDAALERPELVSGLIVISAVPGGFEMQGEPPKYLMEMLAAVRQGDHALASELQMRLWADGPFREPEQVDASFRNRVAEINQSVLAEGAMAFTFLPLPDPLDPPAVQRLNQIQAPTLIVAGGLDNPEILRAADVMANGIPGAKKVILHGSAHLPSMEKPAEFNQMVHKFLRNSIGK
jgi:pimeloyl-ACP methyl ester carboxylesterase